MTAQFTYQRYVWLEKRKAFFICGEIESGPIQQGMTVRVPLNESVILAARFDQIEFLDVELGKEALVALRLAGCSRQEGQQFVDLLEPGESLEIDWPSEDDGHLWHSSGFRLPEATSDRLLLFALSSTIGLVVAGLVVGELTIGSGRPRSFGGFILFESLWALLFMCILSATWATFNPIWIRGLLEATSLRTFAMFVVIALGAAVWVGVQALGF